MFSYIENRFPEIVFSVPDIGNHFPKIGFLVFYMRKHFTEIVFLILYIENCFPQIVFSSFIKEAEKTYLLRFLCKGMYYFLINKGKRLFIAENLSLIEKM